MRILLSPANRNRVLYITGFIFVLLGISLYNYLLFHTIAELWSIVIAILVAVIAWNSRERLDNGYLLIIGIAYAYIAVIDLLHTLSYQGMGVLQVQGMNIPTQLWITARFLEALSFLAALVFINRKVIFWRINTVYFLFLAAVLISIFIVPVFPAASFEDQGLTAFKIYSEYAIIILLFATLFVLYRKRKSFSHNIYLLLNYAVTFTIIAELFFTLYTHAFSIFNMIGHFSKIISFYLIYLAIARESIINPQKSIFKKLTDSQRKLQKANQAKSEFVYFVSHQFKNPLTSIQLTADLMKKGAAGGLSDDQRRYVSDIEASADKMKDLINTYLNVSRLETGDLPNEPEPLDVRIQLNNLLDDNRHSIERKNLHVSLDVGKNVPIILADARGFDLIFDNLLGNAIKYTPKGGDIGIKAEVRGGRLDIMVADNGFGIPEEMREKIFKKLFRVDNARRAEAKGSGLGLYMVKLVSDTIGAGIDIRSREGGGTVFTASFPLDRFKA